MIKTITVNSQLLYLCIIVLFNLTFLTLNELTTIQYMFALPFYFLVLMAMMGIMGFIIRRFIVDQRFKDDELDSAIDIIESSKNGLDSFINLLELQKK